MAASVHDWLAHTSCLHQCACLYLGGTYQGNNNFRKGYADFQLADQIKSIVIYPKHHLLVLLQHPDSDSNQNKNR
eukprot:14624155-Ditylum_brightwellii.AAC.1